MLAPRRWPRVRVSFSSPLGAGAPGVLTFARGDVIESHRAWRLKDFLGLSTLRGDDSRAFAGAGVLSLSVNVTLSPTMDAGATSSP